MQFAEGRTTAARIDLPLFGLDDAAKEALPKVGVIAHQWRGQYYLVDAVFLNELYLMLPPELRKPTDQPDHDVPPYARDPTFADIFTLDYPTWSDAQLTEREWDAYEACLAVGLGRKRVVALADLYVATATAIRMPSNVRKPFKDHYVSRLLLRHGRFGWLWTEEGLTCRREARSTAADVYRYLATFYPDADADKVNVGLGLITAEKPDGEAEPTDEATEVEVEVEDGACGIALPGLHLGCRDCTHGELRDCTWAAGIAPGELRDCPTGIAMGLPGLRPWGTPGLHMGCRDCAHGELQDCPTGIALGLPGLRPWGTPGLPYRDCTWAAGIAPMGNSGSALPGL